MDPEQPHARSLVEQSLVVSQFADALVAAHRLSSEWGNAMFYVIRADDRFLIVWKMRGDVMRFHSDAVEVAAKVQANVRPSEDPHFIYPSFLAKHDIELLESRRGDPGWNAALHLLTFPPLARKAGIWNNVDGAAGIDFRRMMEETGYMSSGERRLVRIAASCYNGSHTVGLQDVLSGLSDDWFERAVEAMRMATR